MNYNKIFQSACRYNLATIVKHLLENESINIHAKDDEALRHAARFGHKDVITTLLRAGANVHAFDDYALRWAACRGYKDVVALLLENGANVHALDDLALRGAAENGHKDVVEMLNKFINKGE